MSIQQSVLKTIGIGIESTKYTGVEPTHWFFRDDPFTINPRKNHVQKKLGVGKMHSSFGVLGGSEWSEPAGTIYLDSSSYLPILKLIHQTKATTGSDPYTHTGDFDTSEKNSATIKTEDTDKGDEEVNGFVLGSIKETYRMNEIIKVELGGNGKYPISDSGLTPAHDIATPLFIGEFVEVKFATTFAGLSGASAIECQEVDFEFDFGLAEAFAKTHKLGSRNLVRNYGGRTSGKVSLKRFWLDSTYRDYFKNATELAMQIKIENPDVDLGGGVNPSITRQFPKVSIQWNEEEDINDAQMENLEIDIHEGSDGSTQYPFKTILVNDEADA